jgi:hypothetical protein
MTAVELPEDLVRKPNNFLRDLKPGESAWINWLDMVVDRDRRCFLRPEARIRDKSPLAIRATCTEAGFEVLIPPQRFPIQWTPAEFTVEKGYFPVVKLERATDAAWDTDR